MINFFLYNKIHNKEIDMGTKDFRWREPKKPKKGAKKPTATIITPQVEVEVIKKGKKAKLPEE